MVVYKSREGRDLRNWVVFAASWGLYRCRGSGGCSSCCRWSSPQHILYAGPLWRSCGSQCQHRPPSWIPEVACSWHLRRINRNQALIRGNICSIVQLLMNDGCSSKQMSPLTYNAVKVSSLTCAHSGQLLLSTDWWRWSLRRCGGCCSKGWPARATCPAWPQHPLLSWAALLVSHTLHRRAVHQKGVDLDWSKLAFILLQNRAFY